MANEAIQRGIKNSWSLLDFIRVNGVPDLQHNLTNGTTGDKFDAMFFPTTDPKTGKSTMVAFSGNLEMEHTLDAVFEQRMSLQVVQLEESDNYYLCKQGGERELGSNYNWL